MSFESFDQSVSGGAPFEVFKFTGQLREYLYTSNSEEVTFGGDIYLPIPITRTATEVTSVLDSITTVDISVPYNSDLARDFCFRKTQQSLSVEVWKLHRGSTYDTESKREWGGRAVGFAVEGNLGIIKTQSSVQARLSKKTKAPFYQTTCNHVLYDERCKLDRADFAVNATVVSFLGSTITVDDDGYPNGDLVVGEATNTRTSEKRLIVSNVSNVISVAYPFIDLVVGDTLELTLGCPLSYTVCQSRFNNVVNFGGFKFIPTTNPFETDF